ncbi:MAG TPA: cyclase family protein [Candidatus Dependentiae bacterium]|nr:cyclase family protein [Candidatus Dependentiae bacterium]HRQ62587.1 cyclase family protein [Candidatus Dependentiae bacterium]
MHYIDLSRTITPDLPCWPNDPPLVLEQITKYGFVIDNIVNTGMHIGTHIDAAQHMIAGGKSLAQYPVSKFIGRGVILDASGRDTIDVDLLEDVYMQPGDIVLVHTGRDKAFGVPAYFETYPVFTEAFGYKLVEHKISMVGMDSPTPDNYPFPVHQLLLQHDVLIIEMLTNLDKLFGISKFTVIALPPKFDTAGAFARVIAFVDKI